jgi:glycosyltransferase involved in cell wall biosynthesis
MPAYNAAKTIRAAISSVLAQTSESLELIIVDDGSEDETLEVARGFNDSRVRILPGQHQGPAGTRNSGTRVARGKYVSFLDSDDLWLPTYLATMRAALEQEARAAMAYGDAWIMDDATRRIGRSTAMALADPPMPPPSRPLEFLIALLQRNFVFVSATVLRSALVSVGGFDASLARAEDYDLWLRLAARGYRAIRSEGIHAIYRQRRNSLSSDSELMLMESARVYTKFALDGTLPAAVRELAAARETEVATTLARRRTIRGRLEIARGRLGNLRAKVGWRRHWHPNSPEEIATAFPDLRRV